mgnify:CR=1 FL=1
MDRDMYIFLIIHCRYEVIVKKDILNLLDIEKEDFEKLFQSSVPFDILVDY